MKGFLKYSLSLALLGSIACGINLLGASNVQAADTCVPNNTANCTGTTASGGTITCKPGLTTDVCTTVNKDGSQQIVTYTGNNSVTTQNCTSSDPNSCTSATQNAAAQTVGAVAQQTTQSAIDTAKQGIISSIAPAIAQMAYTLLTVLGNLLGMVGLVFNWAVVITVFQFGFYFANSQGMLTAWGILRDIGNVIILFGFIFVGVMMILDLHSFDARRTLPRLVIFAVLLNFSLFAGEAVVDVANVLASQLYNQAGTGSAALATTGTDANSSLANASSATNVGIAGVLMQETGVSSSFSSKPDGDSTKQILTFVGIAIFFIIIMMVLLAGAIMLFIRAVMLSLLLVISPLAFAGMAIPQLEGRAAEWWNKLLANAFFAPIYLLLIFVGLR